MQANKTSSEDSIRYFILFLKLPRKIFVKKKNTILMLP